MLASCRKTNAYSRGAFMPHHSRQMDTFTDGAELSAVTETVSGTTYLLARDEDCENMFHAFADHTNMFTVYKALSLSYSETQVVLFDRFADGPYAELIQKAFSRERPLKRHGDYGGRTVLFERLVFHLESPGEQTPSLRNLV